jgi:hypothetical protein
MKKETFGVHFGYAIDGYYRIRTGKPCCQAQSRQGFTCTRAPKHKGQHRADDTVSVRPWGKR